jgi:hypothetical protein
VALVPTPGMAATPLTKRRGALGPAELPGLQGEPHDRERRHE